MADHNNNNNNNNASIQNNQQQRSLLQQATYVFYIVAAYYILKSAYTIRLVAIEEFGPVIHEFDPYFNFRATEVRCWLVPAGMLSPCCRFPPHSDLCSIFPTLLANAAWMHTILPQ
jgi:asparagine N-glycosylation enzyme membrane subunit Stt3